VKLFYRETLKEHIEIFDIMLADLLAEDYPMYKKTIELSIFDGIGFIPEPKSLAISRRFDSKVHKSIDWSLTNDFDLTGIHLWHRNLKRYIPIRLRFHMDSLSQIFTNNPSNFRQEFDLTKIKKKGLTNTRL